MISVVIKINGKAIIARSAVNLTGTTTGDSVYEVDDGRRLTHVREHGALPLVIAMLAGIVEPGNDRDHSKVYDRAEAVSSTTVRLPQFKPARNKPRKKKAA